MNCILNYNSLYNEVYGRPKVLIICRAGDNSLHRTWFSTSLCQNVDLAVSYYGKINDKYKYDGVYYEKAEGTKFPCLYKFICEKADIIKQYDIIWLPDDDLKINASSLDYLFNIFFQNNLWLAQPSLTADSPHSHPITIQKSNTRIRYTNFVESMAPVFSREALFKCLPTFSESISGWGLDIIWPKLLGMPRNKIAVIDSVAVEHTKPLWQGELYKKLNTDPRDEMTELLQNYGIELPYDMKVYCEY